MNNMYNYLTGHDYGLARWINIFQPSFMTTINNTSSTLKMFFRLGKVEEANKVLIEETKQDLQKKEEECRSLSTKLTAAEKELNRQKTHIKTENEKHQKEFENIEAKLNESR